MEVVKARNLRKKFKLKLKEEGLRGSLKSIFNPVYHQVEALKGINLSVEKGEILAFIGPNGAGKSTTIKINRYTPPNLRSGRSIGINPLERSKKTGF